MGKSDFEVLIFSIYIEHLLENDLLYDDYSIALQLEISESRVRNLKIKKELQYTYSKYNWKKAFVERIGFAQYDGKTALVNVNITESMLAETLSIILMKKTGTQNIFLKNGNKTICMTI